MNNYNDQANKMKKRKLAPGFKRRFFILLIVYLMFMVVVWSSIAAYFRDGIDNPLVIGLLIGGSILIFIILIVSVEISNYKRIT
jgi:uncharacterized RDD family membrane protein YckC